MLEMRIDEIDEDEDGGGRRGGKWHFGTDQCTTGHQAEYVIQVQYEKTPMYDVVREKIHLRGYSRTRVDR